MDKNKTAPWDTFALFESLLKNYHHYKASAQRLQSSNEEDTYEIKLGIIGFSLFQPSEKWNYEFYQLLKQRLDGELSSASLGWHGAEASTYAQFACLAIGALLGKFDAGEIDEKGFLLGDAHLPGFMMLHLKEIS